MDVLRGNTKDETTVLDKIEELKKNYGIEKIVFVGDRGMVKQTNYKQNQPRDDQGNISANARRNQLAVKKGDHPIGSIR